MADIATLGLELDGRKLRSEADASTASLNRMKGAGVSTQKALAALGITIGTAVVFQRLISELKEATRYALEFNKAMAEVNTLLGDTENLDEVSRQVRALSVEFNQAPVDQARALYQVISAGAESAAEASKILEVANRLAVGGVTDVATAADGLTSILNAYGLSAGQAAGVSDALFVAMKAGKTTIGELSGALGRVAPLAASVGISIDELSAATAALTKGGISTRESITGLRAIMAAVLGPTTEAAETAERLGIEFNATALETMGLAGFMDMLVEKTGGGTETLAQLFGGVEALVPAMALAGQAGADLNAILGDMEEKTGATGEAFDKVAGSDAFRLERALKELKDATIDIGNAVLVYLVPAMETLADNIDRIIAGARIATAIVTGDGAAVVRILREMAEQGDAVAVAQENAVTLPPTAEEFEAFWERTHPKIKKNTDAVEELKEAVDEALAELDQALALDVYQNQLHQEVQVALDVFFRDFKPEVVDSMNGEFGRLAGTMIELDDVTVDVTENTGDLAAALSVLSSFMGRTVSGILDVAAAMDAIRKAAEAGASEGTINKAAAGLDSAAFQGVVLPIIGQMVGTIKGLFDQEAADRAKHQQMQLDAIDREREATERFREAVVRFENAVGGTPASLTAWFEELNAQLEATRRKAKPRAVDPLEIEAERLRLEQLLGEKIAEVTLRFREELEIRELLARGMDDEAALRALEIDQRQEMVDAINAGWDQELLDWLAEIQGIEWQNLLDSLEDVDDAVTDLTATFQDFRARALDALGFGDDAARFRRERAYADELANEDLTEGERQVIEALRDAERLYDERQRDLASAIDSLELELAAKLDELKAAEDDVRANLDAQLEAIDLQIKVAEEARDQYKEALAVAQENVEAINDQLSAAKESLQVAEEQLRTQEQQVAATRQVVDSLRSFGQGLLLGDQSTLSPIAKLAESRSQYESLLSAARGGDLEAAGTLPQAAQAFLAASRDVNASSTLYAADFAFVRQTVAEIEQQFGGRLTSEERMLGGIQRQVSAAEAQVASLEEQKQVAEDALDVLRDIDQAARSQASETIAELREQADRARASADSIIDQLREQAEQARDDTDAVIEALIAANDAANAIALEELNTLIDAAENLRVLATDPPRPPIDIRPSLDDIAAETRANVRVNQAGFGDLIAEVQALRHEQRAESRETRRTILEAV